MSAEMEKPFAGKVALITGGTRGIGRATALRLASMGADIVLNYSRNEADAKTVADEVKTLGVRAQCLRADIGDLDDLESLFTQVDADPGRLDFLVNSAARGLERPRDAMRSLPKHLRHTFEINVLGPWFAAKAAAPLM